MSDSEDLSSFSALSLGPEIPYNDRIICNEDDAFSSLTEFESAKSKHKSSSNCIRAPNNTQIVEALKGVEIKDPHEIKSDKLSIDKCLSKCATFPSSARGKCSKYVLDEIGEKGYLTVEDLTPESCAQSANSACHHSGSLPTPLKLVSAMKGSREKLGAPLRNLRVTWAPDVYDPIPTAVSHVPNKKFQRYRNDNKRNGKNKKGGSKASRSKGKDKKQSRKSGAGSSKQFKFADNEGSGDWSGGVDFGVGCPDPFSDSQSQSSEALSGGQQAGTLDFGVNSPDPFCGHSLMKNSVASMHFSVTEAT